MTIIINISVTRLSTCICVSLYIDSSARVALRNTEFKGKRLSHRRVINIQNALNTSRLSSLHSFYGCLLKPYSIGCRENISCGIISVFYRKITPINIFIKAHSNKRCYTVVAVLSRIALLSLFALRALKSYRALSSLDARNALRTLNSLISTLSFPTLRATYFSAVIKFLSIINLKVAVLIYISIASLLAR